MVLERRLQLGRAAVLCDWRQSLRAWRAWRTLVWATRDHREREATEEELRTEHRYGAAGVVVVVVVVVAVVLVA